jgi:hypothetical protein
MDANLVRDIEIDADNARIRYVPIQNKLWFVITDICKIIGANLANIYSRLSFPTQQIKIKKLYVRVTDISGVEEILSTSRSEKVDQILDILAKVIRKYNRQFKEKLIEKKYLFNKCYICGLAGLWQGKPLDMILPDNTDLFLLCPNCYSQTERLIFIETCRECDRNIPTGHKFCLKCQSFSRAKPNKEKLKKDLIKHGIPGVEKKYGIDKETIMSWMNE